MLERRYVLGLSLVIVSSSALALLCIHKGHNWGDDFAQYIEQARAINNHSLDSYLQINRYAMDHSDHVVGPYLSPNGFPLLIAPCVEGMVRPVFSRVACLAMSCL
jgi:hypothetical protein